MLTSAMVTDKNDKAYFVQKQGQTYRLPLEQASPYLSLGQVVEGFAYENQDHQKVFTMQVPAITQDSYGWATVTQVRKDLGVFLDIGLPDKDMVLSLDELPSMKELWPKKGAQLYVTLIQDKKGRTWASLGDGSALKGLVVKAGQDLMNKDLSAKVVQAKLVGTYLLTQDNHMAFLHPTERFHEPSLGQEVQVRVIGVRPDGVLNVSMRPRAHEAISDDANMLLTLLQNRPDRMLPYWDKSDPSLIQQALGISKGQFKRAVGSLLKAGKIIQEPGSIRLKEGKDEETQ